MKKIYYLIFFIGSLLVALPSCEVDNYPLPDAKVFGEIRDVEGGGLVETDLNSGSQIGVYELGQYAANPVRKVWYIKQSGEYRNDLVYSNDYRFEFTGCNFFPQTEEHTISPGENELNFTVTPYIRINDLSIVYNESEKKVTATFKLEGGEETVQVGSVTLYAWTDIYVGAYVKKSLVAGTGTPSRSFTGPARVIDPEFEYELSIDLAANDNEGRNGFGVARNYYFRVGAQAIQSGVGTIRPNYAPYEKFYIDLD